MNSYPTANILGVRVNCLDTPRMMGLVQTWCKEEQKRTIFYAHSKSMNVAYQDPPFCTMMNRADLIYSDGISVVWAGRLLSGLPFRKMTGADWIHNFGDMAADAHLRIYLVGSLPGIARAAGSRLEQEYPGLKVTGVCDGFFKEKSQEQVLHEIASHRPDVVFVGMGTPNQEQWILDHRAEIQSPVCWGVGALFDFIAGKEKRVPPWMNTIGLEWLWRFLLDPLGKWNRTLVGNPLFVIRVLHQKFYKV